MPTVLFNYDVLDLDGDWRIIGPYADGQVGVGFTKVIAGTDAKIPTAVGVPGSVVSVYVDNGSETNPTVPLGAEGDLILFSGLSDGPHLVKFVVKAIALDINMTNCLSVTGANPSVSSPLPIKRQYRVSRGGTNTVLLPEDTVDWLQTGSYSVGEGLGRGVNYQNGRTNQVDTLLKFPATTSSIEVFAAQNGQKYRLEIDGVLTDNYYTAPLGGYTWLTLFEDLDDSEEHHYAIYGVSASTSWIYSLRVAGEVNTEHVYEEKPIIAGLGDSIMENIGTSTGDDSTKGWLFLISKNFNSICYNRGRSGTYLSSSLGGENSGESKTSLITEITPDPSRIFLMYGANDATAGIDASTYKTSFVNTLNSLISGSDAPICILEITDNPGSQTKVNELNAEIPNAILECDDPSRCQVIPMGGVISEENFVSGAHPNIEGNIEIFNYLVSVLDPPSPSETKKLLPSTPSIGNDYLD